MKDQCPTYSYIVGNVCQDPQKRTGASGKSFYVFDIGIHHKGMTEFISVSSLFSSVRKGDFIRVDGPVRPYRKKDGTLKQWMNSLHIGMLRRALPSA